MTNALAAVAAIGLLCAGCGVRGLKGQGKAKEPAALRAPDGRRAYWVKCKRSALRCYQFASARCERGYDVIDGTIGDEPNVAANMLSSLGHDRDAHYPAKEYSDRVYEMMFSCKR